MHNATMRPYEVLGKTYSPTMATVGESFDGIASWYGADFHEKKTSNGETYDMYADTAASKTLPMNTMVKVYNKDNGKSTIVRINDRGPFVEGRIIDLSNSAASAIDMVGKGTANVEITV
ncbi:MAG: septal ring lytic transglycosylase RlpA family protein, partial [Arcobacter sp.]|nr:septal ring lytic transglycosylase RlpA family protein [Arcobacter sp.]